MIRFAFKKGLRFLQRSAGWTLLRKLATGKIQFEKDDGELVNLEECEVHRRWMNGDWQIDEQSLGISSNVFFDTSPKDLRALPQKEQEAAKRKQNYILQIERMAKEAGERVVSCPDVLKQRIDAVATASGDAHPPSAATVWRWFQKYSRTKCPTKLVDGRRNAGCTHNDEQRRIFEEAISEVFLTPQKRPGKEVVDVVRTKVKRFNEGRAQDKQIHAPSKTTIYRWLSELNYQITQNARQGKAATDRELRAAIGGVKAKRLLERVEIDHTPLDLMIICKLTKMILGRPWLTLAIDRATRMIVGFYISFHAPSATSVLYCLRMMMLPKDHILAKYPDIEGPWPARGIPERLVMDNGMELHAEAVAATAQEMGIELMFCGVAQPQMKGAIERLFRTLNTDLIHQLPGTTFANIDQRGDYDSEKHAALDLEVLTHALVMWIAEDYNKTPHKGLKGKTPLEVWQEQERGRILELPAYPKQLDAMVGRVATRTLFHYGLEYNKLIYNSQQLQGIRHRDGGTPMLQVRGFDHDVGTISVFDPHIDEFIDVPAVDQDYAAGLNDYVHQLCCQEARARFNREPDQERLRTVKESIQAIVEEAVRANKVSTRKKAAKLMLNDSEQIFNSDGAAALKRALKQKATASTPSPDMDSGGEDVLPRFARVEHSERETA